MSYAGKFATNLDGDVPIRIQAIRVTEGQHGEWARAGVIGEVGPVELAAGAGQVSQRGTAAELHGHPVDPDERDVQSAGQGCDIPVADRLEADAAHAPAEPHAAGYDLTGLVQAAACPQEDARVAHDQRQPVP